ncbi:hypothetical protein JCM6882_004867 [Rhodosporidiobolus microsporus]
MLFSSSSYAGVSNPDLFCQPVNDEPVTSFDLSNSSFNGVLSEKNGLETQREAEKEFDYVICGGGTAGCVLASRLSEDPHVKVLLIEAGESDQKELNSLIPARWRSTFGTNIDWQYMTLPQLTLNNREVQQPRGKVLGGCSAINAQAYQRCPPQDYNDWATSGAAGWGWKDLKPYFDKAEGFSPNPEHDVHARTHSSSGPWQTGFSGVKSELSSAFVETGPAIGLSVKPDLNAETNSSGISHGQTFVAPDGVRSSTSAAYLPPFVFQSRPNLNILTGTLCTRVLFADEKNENGNAKVVGVEVGLATPTDEKDEAKRWIARAHSARGGYILSFGAFGSPQVLLCGGVGRVSTLKGAGVETVVELNGVGEGLKDHLYVSVSFVAKKGSSLEWTKEPWKTVPSLLRWFAFGTGPLAVPGGEGLAFMRADDVQEDGSVAAKAGAGAPDLELVLSRVCREGDGVSSRPLDAETNDFFTLVAVCLKPHSTGTVSIKSGDVREKALVDPRYLSDTKDEEVLVKGLKVIRRLVSASPLKDYVLSVASPRLSLDDFDKLGDEELMEYSRSVATTIHHPMGTCKMGPCKEGGVVHPSSLKVYGCANLRVCDASIFPLPLGGHPCAAVVAVAEKFADMLKAEQKDGGWAA